MSEPKPIYDAGDAIVFELPEDYDGGNDDELERIQERISERLGVKAVIVPNGCKVYRISRYAISRQCGSFTEEFHFNSYDEMLKWEKMQNPNFYPEVKPDNIVEEKHG